MTSTKTDYQAVHQVMQQYVDASRNAEVSVLKDIFHPNAIMPGYVEDDLWIGGPEPYFEELASRPSLAASGADYRAVITAIEVTGRVASAALKETNMFGMDYTDYFHLLKENGKWRIISKTYTSE